MRGLTVVLLPCVYQDHQILGDPRVSCVVTIAPHHSVSGTSTGAIHQGGDVHP